MALNIWTGLGRLCHDPELKKTQSGKDICTVRLAVERDIKREGEDNADFITVTAFDKTAEFIAKYFHKGETIIITGALQNDNYTDKDGNKRYGFKIMARHASFAGGALTNGAEDEAREVYRNATKPAPAPAKAWTPPTPEQPSFVPLADTDDDLPF